MHASQSIWYITLTESKKNQMIISIYAEKAFDKIQHLFMLKILNKLDTEGTYLVILKALYIMPQLTSYPLVKGWKLFLLRLETRPWCPLAPLLFHIAWTLRTIRQEKDKRQQHWKARSKMVSICKYIKSCENFTKKC